MAYRRSSGNYNSWANKAVNVTLAWNSLVGAYDLKFDEIRGNEKWGKVKSIIAWIKMTIPYGERDYDDEHKIWTIHEKYFTQLRDILMAIGSEFNVTVVERPAGGAPTVAFTPLSVYFDIFKDTSGTDISAYAEDRFNEAKRIYFKTSMRIHPDRNPNDPDAASKMSAFNAAWDGIKERHFKQAKIMSQIEV